jgi:hypothetical protein
VRNNKLTNFFFFKSTEKREAHGEKNKNSVLVGVARVHICGAHDCSNAKMEIACAELVVHSVQIPTDGVEHHWKTPKSVMIRIKTNRSCYQ